MLACRGFFHLARDCPAGQPAWAGPAVSSCNFIPCLAEQNLASAGEWTLGAEAFRLLRVGLPALNPG